MSGINIARLERELGGLSRTDRKAAIEQLQRLVREVSFDLAAGASHEVECCPRCGGLDFVKKGKSPPMVRNASSATTVAERSVPRPPTPLA